MWSPGAVVLTGIAVGSVILAATPVGFSAKESLLELLAVEGAGDSLPPTLRSGVDVAEGSMSTPVKIVKIIFEII